MSSKTYPLSAVYSYSGWTRCCYAVLDALARNGGYADLQGENDAGLSSSGKKRACRIPGLIRQSPYGKKGVELTREGWALVKYCRGMYDLDTDTSLDDWMRASLKKTMFEDEGPSGMLLRRASTKNVIWKNR